jgi:hypothetical protein
MIHDEELLRMSRRIDSLERGARRSRMLSLALFLVGTTFLVTTCGDARVSTSQLTLRDSQGRLRVEVSAAGRWPYLRFFDTTGALYTSLETDSLSAEPVLRFKAGNKRQITAEFGSSAIGASVTSLLDDEFQASVTALSVSPVVLFTGPDRGARLELKDAVPHFVFVDADGNVTGSLARQR